VQNLLDQLPTLIGVVLGAVGAVAATSLSDRLRWQREQAVRWYQRRLEAFMAFAATLKTIHTVSFRLVAMHRPGSSAPPIDRPAGLEQLAHANLRRSADWEALLLLGDEATVAAARRWRDAVSAVELLARGAEWDGAAWETAVDEADRARDQFYVFARQALGVRKGSVEQFATLRTRRLER
jgi:hypothetical protein